jgi:hypothetical protein
MRATAMQVDGGVTFQEDAADLSARELALVSALRADEESPSDLYLFPAGYFCVKRRADVDRLAKRVHGLLAGGPNTPVVLFGIDVASGSSKFSGVLRAFAVRAGGSLRTPVVLQQVSARSSEELLAPDVDPFEKQERFLRVAGKKIAVCICGEVWSLSVRSYVVSQRPDIVLDLAHGAIKTGKGPRSWSRPFGALAQKTGPIFVAEHTRSPARQRVWPLRAGRGLEKPEFVEPAGNGVWMAPVTVAFG